MPGCVHLPLTVGNGMYTCVRRLIVYRVFPFEVNPFLTGCIRCGKCFSKRVAKARLSILMSVFNIDSGRHEEASVGSLPGFGINTMRASRIDWGSTPTDSASWNTSSSFSAIISACLWYNSAGSLSPPVP